MTNRWHNKDLEGKRVEPIGWEHAGAAKQEIERAIARYQKYYGEG